MDIVVKGKTISLSGLTSLLVQGEIYPVTIRFKFNTESEHTELSTITDWTIYYQSEDGETYSDSLSKETSQTDDTWSLCWNVKADATEIVGNLIIGIIRTYGTTKKWKTLPCVLKVEYGIEDITQEL